MEDGAEESDEVTKQADDEEEEEVHDEDHSHGLIPDVEVVFAGLVCQNFRQVRDFKHCIGVNVEHDLRYRGNGLVILEIFVNIYDMKVAIIMCIIYNFVIKVQSK